VRDGQLQQQDLHTTSTDAGLSIVSKPFYLNTDSSIRRHWQFDSNVTDGRDVQLKKPDSLMMSLLDPITTLVDLPK
jgi:hypothetical protein